MSITVHSDYYNTETRQMEKTIRTFAEGCVLEVGSRTAQIMSDVYDSQKYALYWDEERQVVTSAHLFYHCESGAWEHQSHAEVDATDEVWEKVRAFYEERAYRKYEGEALREANRITKDSVVKVVSGRANKGTEGKVVVVIQRPYGMGYRSSLENKVGIATSEVMVDKIVNGRVYKNHRDMVWAWARNCELAVVPSIDTETIRKAARKSSQVDVDNLRRPNQRRWA